MDKSISLQLLYLPMKSVGTTGQVSIKLFGAHFASCKREEQMFDACDFRFTSVISVSQFSISIGPVGHLRITFLELQTGQSFLVQI